MINQQNSADYCQPEIQLASTVCGSNSKSKNMFPAATGSLHSSPKPFHVHKNQVRRLMEHFSFIWVISATQNKLHFTWEKATWLIGIPSITLKILKGPCGGCLCTSLYHVEHRLKVNGTHKSHTTQNWKTMSIYKL